ncbi:hypothetical protein cco6_09251 [Campylobacter coli 59-2]|nr:hypothetical protein cco6_09251 [Campylobacter coli 59-2]
MHYVHWLNFLHFFKKAKEPKNKGFSIISPEY